MAKANYKVNNWSEYNKALVTRVSVTCWLDKNAIAVWHDCEPNGQGGRDEQFSDTAITTALMIQAVFGLNLRQIQGFIDSIFALMGVNGVVDQIIRWNATSPRLSAALRDCLANRHTKSYDFV